MPTYSKNDVVLVRYPFSNATTFKIRPAVVVGAPHVSQDLLIVPLTSRLAGLLPGECALSDSFAAGLNVASAVKRGIYTVHSGLVLNRIGSLTAADVRAVEGSLRAWLGLP
jgi:mRNA interferase MazF